MDEQKVSHIIYRYKDPAGTAHNVALRFNRDDFALIVDDSAPPDWTGLDACRCLHCPMTAATTRYCRFAQAIAPLSATFAAFSNPETMGIEVTTDHRTVSAAGAIREGTSSLIGLIGATSGCPHLDFFRPLARFHQPFASEEETLFRVFSTHLLGCRVRNDPPTLESLRGRFSAAALVHAGMARRLGAAFGGNASPGVRMLLDIFSTAATYVMDRNFDDLRYILRP